MSTSDLLLPVYGLIVGMLVGLTGMGGGVIMTPILMLGLGLPATTAVGTDLAYATLTKMAGTWQHWRQGTVDGAVVRGLALGSVPASLVAVVLVAWLRRANHDRIDGWLEHAIGGALLLAALLMLYRLVRGRGRATTAAAAAHARAKLIAIGALGGLMVGLTSIGSGSLILALLVLVVPLGAERLVGTDVAHATLLVGTAAIAHLFAGDVNLGMVGWLVTGSIPGILIGSRLVLRVPRRPLQIGLAGLLLTTSVPLLR
jgi:uncharacterized membrane protein YfcA